MNEVAPSTSLCNRDLPHEVRHELFDGKRAVRVWNLAAAPALPFTAVLACELEPGGSVGTHLQEHFPEIVVGISGSGSVSVNQSVSAFSAGHVVELARGHTLSIVNTSNEEPLRYLIIKAQSSTLPP
jgi:quercetin dioxygenase-like cupin family protein